MHVADRRKPIRACVSRGAKTMAPPYALNGSISKIAEQDRQPRTDDEVRDGNGQTRRLRPERCVGEREQRRDRPHGRRVDRSLDFRALGLHHAVGDTKRRSGFGTGAIDPGFEQLRRAVFVSHLAQRAGTRCRSDAVQHEHRQEEDQQATDTLDSHFGRTGAFCHRSTAILDGNPPHFLRQINGADLADIVLSYGGRPGKPRANQDSGMQDRAIHKELAANEVSLAQNAKFCRFDGTCHNANPRAAVPLVCAA